MTSENTAELVLHAAPDMPCQRQLTLGCEALRSKVDTSSQFCLLCTSILQYLLCATIRLVPLLLTTADMDAVVQCRNWWAILTSNLLHKMGRAPGSSHQCMQSCLQGIAGSKPHVICVVPASVVYHLGIGGLQDAAFDPGYSATAAGAGVCYSTIS